MTEGLRDRLAHGDRGFPDVPEAGEGGCERSGEATAGHWAEQDRIVREELALNRLLDRLKPGSVSPEFTLRVLERVHRDQARPSWSWRRALEGVPGNAWLGAAVREFVLAPLRGPVVRWAGGAALLCLGLGVWFQQGDVGGKGVGVTDPWLAIELSREVWVAGLDPESLANFEVIQRLNAFARPEDDELVIALMR